MEKKEVTVDIQEQEIQEEVGVRNPDQSVHLTTGCDPCVTQRVSSPPGGASAAVPRSPQYWLGGRAGRSRYTRPTLAVLFQTA